MTQMYADKTVLHLRSSAPSADKAFRQSPGHAIASAHPGSAADCGLLLVCPIVQHVDMMPRQTDAQLRAPDRLRQDAVRLVPERLFDDVHRPDLQRLGHHLRPRKPLPERRRPQLNVPITNGLGHLPPRPPEEPLRLHNADMRPWL